jgi:hypothetical protein
LSWEVAEEGAFQEKGFGVIFGVEIEFEENGRALWGG